MEWFALLAVLVAAPIALLMWTRRDRFPGADDSDPHANRDLGGHGGPPVRPPGSDVSGGL